MSLSPVEGRRLNHQTAWEALNLIVEPPCLHPLPEGRLPFDEVIVRRWQLSDLIMVRALRCIKKEYLSQT